MKDFLRYQTTVVGRNFDKFWRCEVTGYRSVPYFNG